MQRKIKRQVARARMEACDIPKINKKRVWDDNFRKEKTGQNKGQWVGGWRSYFAKYWKKYLDPTTAEYKMAMKNMANKTRLQFMRGLAK